MPSKTHRPAAAAAKTSSAPAAALARGLAGVLADTYAVYLQTQNYHWNVEGPHFPQYHQLFQQQYEALAPAIDQLAEAIRTLGFRAPGSFAEFAALSALAEAGGGQPDAAAMIQRLHDAHGALLRRIAATLPLSAGDDFAWVNDLLIERQDAHGKLQWMLRATAGGGAAAL